MDIFRRKYDLLYCLNKRGLTPFYFLFDFYDSSIGDDHERQGIATMDQCEDY